MREDGAGLRILTGHVDEGDLRLRVDSTFAIREIHAAHTRFQQRGLNGKVTLLF